MDFWLGRPDQTIDGPTADQNMGGQELEKQGRAKVEKINLETKNQFGDKLL